MNEFFASGRVADALLLLMAAEALALYALWRASGRGVAPRDYGLTVLSGVFLVLALRQALIGDWWGWTGLFLALGGLAHAADIRRRWRS